MKATEFSLRHPVTVLIITMATIFFGIYSYTHMGVERMPNVEFPLVVVSTTMDGASPAIMDSDVTDVLEARINTIEGIKEMTSYSYEGRSLIVIEFEMDRDIDFAASDVRGKVNMAQNSLPDDCDVPQVDKYDPTDRPVMQIAIKNDGRTSQKDMSRFVDKIVQEQLQTAKGVGRVSLSGFSEREIDIWLRPDDLERYKLTQKDIRTALYNKHVELPAGRVEGPTKEYGIRIIGEYPDATQLENLPIAVRNGAVVRLRDVARVEDTFKEKRSMAVYEGKKTIIVQVRKQKGANEVLLSKMVKEKLAQLNAIAPKGLSLEVVRDNSIFIINSMNGVFWDTIMAILLTSIIMFAFLRTLRATFIAVISIPVCLLGSIIFLNWFGLTINNMSMMGISLAVGMVVDATTVILENIYRHKELGKNAFVASEEGTNEVAFSVIAGAATTLAVFLPIAFMGGIMGRYFNTFGITVAATISISLLVSVTLTPYLASRLLGRNLPPKKWQIAMEQPLINLEKAYRKALAYCTSHRRKTMYAAFAFFILGLIIASTLGSEFFPKEDQGQIRAEFELPADSSLGVTTEITRQAIELIQKDPAVAYTFGSIGSGAGEEVYKSTIQIKLVDRKKRDNATVVQKRLRELLSRFKDANVKMGSWGSSDVTAVIHGPTSEALAEIGEKMKRDIEQNPSNGLADVILGLKMDKPRINLYLNRALADDLDISIRDLSSEMLTWFMGDQIGTFNDGGYRYKIRLRSEAHARDDISEVLRTLIKTKTGEIIQADGIITPEIGPSPTVITRHDRQRSIKIEANVNGIDPGQGYKKLVELFNKYQPHDGTFSIVPSAETRQMQESSTHMMTALVFAIILVYIVMAIQFESFLHPFTVMFSLPLMTAGSFGLLAMANVNSSVMSMMGLILLVGIVVNNAIILVDFINQLRERGMDKVAAVLEAGPLRLRAILMTTVSTLIGAVPVALALSEGGETRQPMSLAIIGGLTTSTLLTLFVIPVIYLIFDDIKDRTGRKLRRYKAYLRYKEIQSYKKDREMTTSHVNAKNIMTKSTKSNTTNILIVFLLSGLSLIFACRVCLAETKLQQPTQAQEIQMSEGLTLQNAIDIALKNNANLRTLALDVEKAKASRLVADVAFLPSLTIAGNATRQKLPVVPALDKYTDTSVGATLTQIIYSGGKVPAGVRQIAAQYAMALATYEEGKNDALRNVYKLYFDVVLWHTAVEIAEDAKKTAEAILKETQTKVKLGLANKLELIRAQQQVAESVAKVADNKSDLRLAEANLYSFLGIPLKEKCQYSDEIFEPSVDLNDEASIATARQHRYDLVRLRKQLDVQKEQIKIERAALLPTLSAFAKGSYLNPYNRQDTSGDTWSVGLTLDVPLFDRNVARRAVKIAKATLEQNKISLTQKELDIENNVKTAIAEILGFQDAVKSKKLAEDLAKESLRLARLGYKEGVTQQVDLLKAQDDYAQAQYNYEMAKKNYLMAVVALKYVEGTLINWTNGQTMPNGQN
ncbi:MAG: efflux RND transporter permease subunit [Synergistaceae bacterium]|nr:efflux RND transporter permease subunit [Synergistaceae bacterium]